MTVRDHQVLTSRSLLPRSPAGTSRPARRRHASRRRSGPRRPCRSRWRRTTRRRSNSPTLDLDDRIRAGIADRGFVRTTPIQSAVFPIVFQGADLIACAETGTGKTAAFLLPIMQRLLASNSVGTVRVLVLAPTRELAVQIEDDFTGFAYHTALTGIAVYGGVDGDMQFRALRAGADVVVATPGRLLDHMNTGLVDFSKVEVLVLDEADRMLDMGFWPDVRKIVSALPAARQTLLFSATTSSDVVTLAEQVMRDPRFIQIGRAGGPATTIAHIAHMMPAREKVEWLTRFLRRTHAPSLIFVRTKRGADQLASSLASRGVRCAPLHADRTQKERIGRRRGVPVGPPHGAGRHRHRRPRPRHRRHRARHQLRRAAHARQLRAPRRAHGPRRGGGHGHHARRARRTADAARHREVHRHLHGQARAAVARARALGTRRRRVGDSLSRAAAGVSRTARRAGNGEGAAAPRRKTHSGVPSAARGAPDTPRGFGPCDAFATDDHRPVRGSACGAPAGAWRGSERVPPVTAVRTDWRVGTAADEPYGAGRAGCRNPTSGRRVPGRRA